MELSQSGMPSGLPLGCLHPALVIELGGMNKMPASVTDKVQPGKESFVGKYVYAPI